MVLHKNVYNVAVMVNLGQGSVEPFLRPGKPALVRVLGQRVMDKCLDILNIALASRNFDFPVVLGKMGCESFHCFFEGQSRNGRSIGIGGFTPISCQL